MSRPYGEYRIFDYSTPTSTAIVKSVNHDVFAHYTCASNARVMFHYSRWARNPDRPVRCALCGMEFQLTSKEPEPTPDLFLEHYL